VPGLGDGTSERWYGDGGVMKRGPFFVADDGVGPLITQRGNLVLYAVDSGQSKLRNFLLLGVAVLLRWFLHVDSHSGVVTHFSLSENVLLV